MIKRQADEAKLDRRCTPHTWRHTWSVEALRRNVSWDAIQGQLGHSRIETTAQYLRSLVPSEAIKSLKGSEWVEPG